MRYLLVVLAVLVGFAGMARAEWPIPEMNAAIDQTNFIVDDQCSGTLISIKERLLLTNNHCVENRIKIVEEEITSDDGTVAKVRHEKFEDSPVTQNRYKGFEMVGSATFLTEIVAHDKKRDLAILRFKQETIPFTIEAKLLPDGIDLVRGQHTVTVGNPMLFEASIVRGEISSLTRQVEIDGVKRDYIQVSGGIYGGNSGGALYDDLGRLIGVPAAGSRNATFIGLAIPVHAVKALLRESCLAKVFDAAADDAKCKADKEKKARDGKGDKSP